MSSTFLPLEQEQNALKVATSIQEWCGHTYMQLNQKNKQYHVKLYSYFQSEGNKEFIIEDALLENQVPSQLRLDPEKMPVGKIEMVPSTEYSRLTHTESNILPAIAQLTRIDSSYVYTINYQSGRSVKYITSNQFPYIIQSWEENFPSHGGSSMTRATLKNTLRTPYWTQNSAKYEVLRDSLQL